jgi:hypothetical protein
VLAISLRVGPKLHLPFVVEKESGVLDQGRLPYLQLRA